MTTINAGDLVTAAQINQWAPVGAVIEYAGVTPPNGWFGCDFGAISRATYSDLLGKVTWSQNGTRNGTTVITGLGTTTGMRVGMAVEGTGISGGTTIASVDSGSQITLSASATGSGTNTVTVFMYGNGDGSTTFNVPDGRGRMVAQWVASSGHADVSGMGGSDGGAVGVRRPKHNTTRGGVGGTAAGSTSSDGSHSHVETLVVTGGSSGWQPQQVQGDGNIHDSIQNTEAAGTHGHTFSGATVTFTGTLGTNDSGATDAPSYLVLNRIIRAKDV